MKRWIEWLKERKRRKAVRKLGKAYGVEPKRGSNPIEQERSVLNQILWRLRRR